MTKKPPRPTRRSHAQKSFTRIWLLLAVAALVGLVLLAQFVAPSPPKTIRLAGGLPGGAYHAFAQQYRDALAAQGLTVEVRESEGSLHNLALLQQGEVDVAFVQSGTRRMIEQPELLRGIASLYYEPLWIFHKGSGSVDQLTELRGKRLAIGNPQSGTFAVCSQLLLLNGIDEQNTDLRPLDMHAAADALLQGDIDFAFFTASPDAEVVRRLMVDPQTRLVGIRRHKAYVRNVLFVTDVEIAEGTFDLRQNFPREDLVVLATVATLTCTKDLHPAVVELLTRTARDMHSGRGLLRRGGEFPSPDNLEFAIHEAASDYFQSGPSLLARYLPFWLANLLKKLLVLLIPIVTLLIPLMKIAPVAFKAIMRKRIHRFYDDLDQIEDALENATAPADLEQCRAELDALTHRVETDIQVPTSYRNEEYDLRLHLAHVRTQLDRAREQ